MAGQIRAFNLTAAVSLPGLCRRCMLKRINQVNPLHHSRYYSQRPVTTSQILRGMTKKSHCAESCNRMLSMLNINTSPSKNGCGCHNDIKRPGRLPSETLGPTCDDFRGHQNVRFNTENNATYKITGSLPSIDIEDRNFLSASVFHLHHMKSTNIRTSAISKSTCRLLHTSAITCKEESKMEKTVQALKDEAKHEAEKKEVVKDKTVVSAQAESGESKPSVVAIPKKTLTQRVVAEVKHYYNGFKLLFMDMRVAVRYSWKMLRGGSLTRRERRQLVRTTSDMFRLVPFSVFVIIPFMEFLLPVALKLFPNMLPSTFKEIDREQEKIRKKLKVKLEMAKFLQDTLEETSVTRKGAKGERVADFANFMERIRATGEPIDNDEILKYSKLFEDEITLDNLNYRQLRALCKLLDISVVDMSETVLRFQLQLKMRELEADDRMIQKEGVESLNTSELQEACRARGMRSLGMPELRLRSQLSQWLDLHLKSKIPTSLLLLSRTLYLPESVPTADQLKAIMTELPSTATDEAKVKISEVSGDRVDNKAKLETIKQEESIIQAEQLEQLKEKEKKKAKEEAKTAEELLDTAEAITKEVAEPIPSPSIVDSAPEIKEMPGEVLTDKAEMLEEKLEKVVETEALQEEEEEISSTDLEEIEDILETVAEERSKMKIEQEDLQELKEDVSEYMENVEELKAVMLAGDGEKLEESKAAQRLRQAVNGMIVQMDGVLGDLSKEKEVLLENIEVKEVKMKRSPELKEDEDLRQKVIDQITKHKQELISINELLLAIKRIQKVPDDTKYQKIAQVLDTDQDGVIDITDALKVIELLGKENVNMSSKQISRVTELLKKEELLEQELKQIKMKEKMEKETKAVAELEMVGHEVAQDDNDLTEKKKEQKS